MTSACKTAMVVEDDLILRKTVANYLLDSGLDVVEAGTGDEALEKFEHDQAVDLLFTDIVMPGDVDGMQLAQHVLEHWPGTHVIIASAIEVSPSQVPEQAMFLSKPYRVHDVEQALRHLCG